MRKIINPFEAIWHDKYNCFGCSPGNEFGLHLEFFDTGEGLIAGWQPVKFLEGYPDIVHGGIQTTLLDEIAAWLVYVKCQSSGVTRHIDIDFLHPLRISKGEASLKAQLLNQSEKEALINAELYDGEGVLCAKSTITYFVYPQQIAIKKFNYPGIEAFYKE